MMKWPSVGTACGIDQTWWVIFGKHRWVTSRERRRVSASEQGRPDVQANRALWKEGQAFLDPAKLVFIDETGASTSMTRRCGRSPIGQRLVCKEPLGEWKITTFTAGLRVGGITAPFLLDGTMTGPIFLVYIKEVLAPTLTEGDIVIMDNLPVHKTRGVRQAIEAVGAKLLYLPPYSPDFNPIEQVFSKLKSILRKVAARTVRSLRRAITQALAALSPLECAAYLQNSGYSV